MCHNDSCSSVCISDQNDWNPADRMFHLNCSPRKPSNDPTFKSVLLKFLYFLTYLVLCHYTRTSTRCHFTWDKSLFVGICDTEQGAVLLSAAGVSLSPCQHRLLVDLIIGPSCKVSLPMVRRCQVQKRKMSASYIYIYIYGLLCSWNAPTHR